MDFWLVPRVWSISRKWAWRLQIYGPEQFEGWEQQTGITIERGDVLVIHTGYHRFYPSNWTANCGPIEPDETRYFIKHPAQRASSRSG